MNFKNVHNPGLIVFIGLLLAISLAGAWLVKLNTPFGLGMYPDSVTYVMGARNILQGNGFSQFSGTDVFKPIIHYPPLYSYILATISLTGMDTIRATRFLNIALIGICLLLFSGLVYHETRNKLLSILGASLFLFSMPIFERFTWALTEPLFFTLVFVNYIVFYLFVRSRKPGWVIGLGIATSILFLARYVGIFMAAVWLPAVLLLTNPKSWFKNILLFLVGLLPLMSIHLLRNYLLVGSINNRSIYLQGMPNAMGKMAPGLSVLEGWFTRTGEGLSTHVMTLIVICLLIVALMAVCVITGIKLYKQPTVVGKNPGRQVILFPLSLALLIYIATVLFTVFYYDSQTLLDDRILSPVFFFGLYILMLVADVIYKKGRTEKILVLVCLLTFLAFSIVKFINVSTVLRSDGQGFISAKWRTLPGVEYIRQTNRELIYTDEPLMVYILTGKTAFQVPYTVIDENKSYNENYLHYDYMRSQLFESDGILVLFEDGCHTPVEQWTKTLVRDLRMIEEFANTCVYSP